MKIGVYGGSFNPPHTGHVLAAAELIRALQLDRLLIVPAANPPHKSLAPGSPSPEARLALCRAAFSGVEKAELCDLELRREGKSYTVDTLAALKAANPEAELILIMGTDMFLSFSTWREPERIASLAALAVMKRDERMDTWAQVQREAEQLRRSMSARVIQVENRCVQISSTTVRRLLAFGAPDCLEQPVLDLILQNGWYLTGDSLKGLPFARLREISLSLHDEKRRAHVDGTCETSAALAVHWGADRETARRAGILHDITKALGPKEQLHLCDKYAMMLTPTQRENPKLLHAKTGAVIAREVFGESEEVREAIWWHTTGRAAMTTLEKILYIADYMEPNRSFPGVETLRDLAGRNLDAAVFCGLDQSISHLRIQGRVIDPDSLNAWNYYRKFSERSQQRETL
ncbi:MAG: nicotinate (nicotinamide) nucleotide adenylyltransferase [Oscillospiraceae bacterium]|nr:nicotinate (nicotinamide) nucleotide adenylyltransferase [Oscillospiraceae bacterium]